MFPILKWLFRTIALVAALLVTTTGTSMARSARGGGFHASGFHGGFHTSAVHGGGFHAGAIHGGGVHTGAFHGSSVRGGGVRGAASMTRPAGGGFHAAVVRNGGLGHVYAGHYGHGYYGGRYGRGYYGGYGRGYYAGLNGGFFPYPGFNYPYWSDYGYNPYADYAYDVPDYIYQPIYSVPHLVSSLDSTDSGIAQSDMPADIVVEVPDANAMVSFDGVQTTGTGTVRKFQSPPLPAGDYTYVVTASWMHDGQLTSKTQTVHVAPGVQSVVNFLPG